MPTINVYIDGFNLYYGCLRDTEYRWLDLGAFSRALVSKTYTVNEIKYFTARVKATAADPGVRTRQDFYLRALRTVRNVSVHYGHFLKSTTWMPLAEPHPPESWAVRMAKTTLRHVGLPIPKPGEFVRVLKTEEKGSDVNLACHLAADAFEKKCDAALLITNDSDLLEPIHIARRLGMKVGFAPPVFRPGRSPSTALAKAVSFQRRIRPATLANNQFPPTLTDRKGTFHKPTDW